MRPDDLLGRGHPSRLRGIRPLDRAVRSSTDCLELAAPRREDAAGLADLVLLRAQRHRLVLLALGFVGQAPRLRLERELVAVFRVGNRLRALHDLQPEVERVAPEDVAHVVAADDHHLEADLVGDRLEAGRAHLARRADGEPVAGDEEGLAAVNARAEIGHQVAERSRLPALVERIEALRDAVGGRRDLIGIDRVELLLLPEDLQIPEDERLAADDAGVRGVLGRRRRRGGDRILRDAGLEPGGPDLMHRSKSTVSAARGAKRWYHESIALCPNSKTSRCMPRAPKPSPTTCAWRSNRNTPLNIRSRSTTSGSSTTRCGSRTRATIRCSC